jgi:hypothetical protein
MKNEPSLAFISLIVLVSFLTGWYVGALGERMLGVHKQTISVYLPSPPPAKVKPELVMRDMRIECLAAILHKTPVKNWAEIKRHMARSPNVCLIAQFLYPGDIPEKVAAPTKAAATEAVDHG